MAVYTDIRHNYIPPVATTSSQVGKGALVHIKTLTASSSANLSFVDGSSDVVLDNTYKTYVFEFITMHPATKSTFNFNASVDTGSNYNVTKTSTSTSAYNAESGGSPNYYYIESGDLAEATTVKQIAGDCSVQADHGMGGCLWLFNPSGTTYAKHFMSDTQRMDYSGQGYTNRWLCAGYFNTTSAVDAIQFSFGSGNIDAGTIKMYGVS